MLRKLFTLAFALMMVVSSTGQSNRQKSSLKNSKPIDLLEKDRLTIDDIELYQENQVYYYSKGPHYNIRLCLRLLSVTNDPFHLQHIHSQVAGSYRDPGMYSKAIEHQLYCIKFAIELEDAIAEGYARIQLGNLYFDQQNWERAKELYDKAISISRDIEFPHIETVGLNNLGMIKAAQGAYREALVYYFESLAIRKPPTGSRDGISHS